MDFFNVNNTFFTVLDYQMSYIEFFGTILNLICVFLVVKKNIWNWIIGNAGVILFASLFYQVHLYADLFEQVFFFITGVIGYFMWKKNLDKTEDEIEIRTLTKDNKFVVGTVAIVGTFVLYNVIINLDNWFPKQFPTEASYPLLDTGTTVVSFIATYLMMKRYLENWYLWIAVDIVGIWLYWRKDVPFISMLYVAFLGLAISGAIKWRSEYRKQSSESYYKWILESIPSKDSLNNV